MQRHCPCRHRRKRTRVDWREPYHQRAPGEEFGTTYNHHQDQPQREVDAGEKPWDTLRKVAYLPRAFNHVCICAISASWALIVRRQAEWDFLSGSDREDLAHLG
jgi:hypothetical protein